MGKTMIAGNLTQHRRIIVRSQVKVVTGGEKFKSDWLQANPSVLVLGFFGWTLPSAIPVSGFGNASLFSKFLDSIGRELSHFPSGPSLDSDFWIYFLLYHIGLFLCLLLGQIGFQGRKQGIFE